ncbi:CoA transferase subunit A, partial [Actinomadura adrarensis]
TRAGLGSDVLTMNPGLRTVTSPYPDGEEYVAMPALRMDVALIHLNRADAAGNGQYLGPDPYFDDLYSMAADRCYLSCEEVVPTERLSEAPFQSLLVRRMYVTGVIETPRGAHFTSCVPDYDRDEEFQRQYAAAAKEPGTWSRFEETYLHGDEGAYQAAVSAAAGTGSRSA